MPLLLSRKDTEDLLTWPEAIETARQALIDWAAHEDLNPARPRVHVGKARASFHPGGSPSEKIMGVGMHCEHIEIVGTQQVTSHYPTASILFDTEKREMLAIMLGLGGGGARVKGDDRTASISVAGAQALGRPNPKVLALFGSGKQAHSHLEAHTAAFELDEVRIYSPNAEHRRAFVDRMQPQINTRLVAAESPEAALRGADLVMCATNSTVPVFDGRFLEPGQHVATIGGSNIGLMRSGMIAHKRAEIDDATISRADRLVILSRQQAEQDQQGEIIDPIERGATSWDQITELRWVLSGRDPGRRSDSDVTVFMNNAGTGVVDVALAARRYRKAVEQERGQMLELGDAGFVLR
jgi:ornithine cyclodeaminase/alanine dehydrogenase-like protein (mu-crystallin family)